MIRTDRDSTIQAGENAMKQYARAAAIRAARAFTSDDPAPLAPVMRLLDRAILSEIIEAARLPVDGWPHPDHNPAPRLMEYPNE